MKTMSAYFRRRTRATLANQLVASFLLMFFLIFTLSSVFAYWGILNILKDNAKDTNEQQFKQYDYNLSAFANEVDQVSRQLVLNSELQSMIDFNDLSEIDHVFIMSAAFRNFTDMLSNYKYIHSISFYGVDGFIIRASQQSNEISYDPSSKQYRFYQSEIYDAVKSEAQSLVWLGGYTSEDFSRESRPMLATETTNTKSTPYVTAARSISSYSQTGTLVINVDMKYVTDIYNHASDAKNSETYLINRSGKVVSHTNETKLGKQSIRMVTLSSAQSTFISEEHNSKQIMSYPIDKLDWIIVSEIPLSEFTKDVWTLRQIGITMFIFSLISAAILSRYWIRKVTYPLIQLTTVMKKMEQGNLGLSLELETRNELGTVIRQFNKMSKSIEELMKQKETMEEEKRKLELGALQSQINPHFFYNTLNTIKWMAIMIKADNIAESVTTLSDILHPTFKKHDIFCSIKEEIDYIHNYIRIMNYRFAGEVKLKTDIPDEVWSYPILRFLLQPLVENAIYHGLNSHNGGEITITAVERPNEIAVYIIDNGEGMSEQKLLEVKASILKPVNEEYQEGIGLRNVNRRLQLHYGDRHQLQIQSEWKVRTELMLTLPKVKKS